MDLKYWFSKNRERIWWSDRSTIFYGSTIPVDDLQIGRKIGSITEGHHITIAGTRGGKSTTSIYTNILNYSGGILAFDPKGEITQVVWKRRKRERPFHVLDPFNVVIDKEGSGVNLKNSYWNPLDEIDINHPEAREQIHSLAEACVRKDVGETGNSAHFRETAQIVLRGYIAYVLSDPFIEDNERHLGTVFNLIKYGDTNTSQYSPKKIDEFVKIKLTTNNAANGAAKEAANMLTSVADRERGGILSSVARGIDWINSTGIKSIICHKSSFKLSDAKTKEATIMLILPEEHIQKFSRFTASFFTMAINNCSNHITPQPEGSKRRVLMLMEEFSKLGYFAPVANKITIAAGSYIKFWFIFQNITQLKDDYKNHNDFLGSSDLQAFALDRKDTDTPKFLSESLGRYTKKNSKGEDTYQLMEASEIMEFLDLKSNNQIIIPRQGLPMKLKRIIFTKLFQQRQYGKNTY